MNMDKNKLKYVWNECILMSWLPTDFELERYELDKMRAKTKMVKRRMSEAVGDGEGGTSANPLDAQSVEMFIKNSNLWEKYKTS